VFSHGWRFGVVIVSLLSTWKKWGVTDDDDDDDDEGILEEGMVINVTILLNRQSFFWV